MRTESPSLTESPSQTSDQKRLGLLLFASSLLLLATLVGAMLFGESGGFAPHPDHPSVLQSAGDGSRAMVGWGYALGVSILLLMTVCILLGISKWGRIGRLGRGLIVGCALTALLFTALVVAYARGSGAEGTEGLFGGFPVATAWMLYGIWWFPALMIVGIAAVFTRSWFTDDDLDRFRRLLAQRAAAQSSEEVD